MLKYKTDAQRKEWASLPSEKKAKHLNADAAAHQKYCESLSPKEKAQGKWTQDKHKAFMEGWEKYGNNWSKVAKIVS